MECPSSTMVELPVLRDAPLNRREELFIKKLQLCGVLIPFDDPMSDKRDEDMKRQTLLKLVDYMSICLYRIQNYCEVHFKI